MNSSGAARALGEKKEFHAASGGSGMWTKHEVEWDGEQDTARLTISFLFPFQIRSTGAFIVHRTLPQTSRGPNN